MRFKLFLWRYRFVAASALLGLAVALVLQAIIIPEPTVRAVVITSPVQAGENLRGHVGLTSLPPTAVAETALRDPAEAEELSAAIALVPGQILMPNMTTSSLTQSLPPNRTVASISVDASSLVISKPGQHIDLYSPVREGCEPPECSAQAVAEDAVVLSVTNPQGSLLDGNQPPLVTISVHRDQVAGLLSAVGAIPFRVASH